eukprot:TRINITY_DN15180_c0_g1_i1.p1 TRINITY_DN15180_c0_g1~~TRINITY_DN15180_c0_g1_i1.p1  ORF type:complete len:1213 (-),score=201.71 TRINITY_DN15180_c0_g1_i1:71-3709(-)
MGEQAVRERIATCSSWNVQRQLGRGQYGTAYLVDWTGEAGEHAHGDLAVAKVVGLEFLPEKEHKLASQEVELMRKLRHAHIVTLKDSFLTEAGLELVIVMEYCDSGDLRGEVKRRAAAKPPAHIVESQIMCWFYQLTLALNYMHSQHILHRDLKSSNIFLQSTSSGGHDVKIGDFGIARVLDGTVAVAATVVGTPYYMSPEVCRSEPYGYKSDIWALGCVLYELCMLKHAFESQSLLGLVYKIVSETYDPLPEQYTGDLGALLDRVLDKSHYTRSSGKELASDPYVKRFAQRHIGEETSGIPEIGHADLKTIPETSVLTSTKPLPLTDAQVVEQQRQPPARTSLQPSRTTRPPRSSPSLQGPARGGDVAPPPPEIARPIGGRCYGLGGTPVQVTTPSMPPTVGGAHALSGGDLRAQVLLRRIQFALTKRRQNWLQVFASFDRAGNGQLRDTEFEQAVTSLALGLSDGEIHEVRVHLQGDGGFVPVDRFGTALLNSSPELLRLEEWGRSVFTDLTREATKSGSATAGVAAGAHVRVQGLQSADGQKLNGSEGHVEKWDSAKSRWVVRLSDGAMKSIIEEHLHVLRPAAAPVPSGSPRATGLPDTAALYRLLCEGGDASVPEDRFLSVVRRLLPRLNEAELRKLILLLPKSQDGRVDVEEALAQFVTGNTEQTARTAGPRLPSPYSPVASRRPGTGMLGPSPPRMSPGPHQRVSQSLMPGSGQPSLHPAAVPGTVTSPRPSKSPQTGFMLGATNDGPPQSAGDAGEDRVRAEIALLRLAQRLTSGGRVSLLGPGLDVLRLFGVGDDEIAVDELLAAASVLPLGISRAEAQIVFASVHSSGDTSSPPAPLVSTDVVLFADLFSAAEAALAAGVPTEAASLERLDASRLSVALKRLSNVASGRTSPQDFRFSMMQAEPYLTPCQLEWLIMLTDKDGEGRLIPWSLLARLNPSKAARNGGRVGAGGLAQPVVPPLPPGVSDGTPVARSLPRSVVVAAALTRIHDRLDVGTSRLAFDRLLGLFDLDVQDQLSRSAAASLLAQLRLGISGAEANEIISFLPGGRSVGPGNLQVASLVEVVQSATNAEVEALVNDMHQAARSLLVGRGETFATAILANTDGSDWIPEAEFRRGIRAVMALDGNHANSEELEDRLVLLAEKDAPGDVCWRPFAKTFSGYTKQGFGVAGQTTAWPEKQLLREQTELSTTPETPEKRCGCAIT